MEDYEDDLEESAIEDFQQIINLARETEKAIEVFVDYIRGESIDSKMTMYLINLNLQNHYLSLLET